MLTRTRNDRVLRKAAKSGATNDCVFVTSPDEETAEVEDSKTETALTLPGSARLALVAFAARR